MIVREERNSILFLRLEHGKVHALDMEICDALQESLIEAEQSSAGAIVLTGTGTTFSAGVDLFRLIEGGPDYVRQFVPKLVDVLLRLFIFPRPVVAAVNGNAIAGGCVIACACDYRIAIKGRGKIGVPEGLVGVPFPPVALEIMRFAADHRRFQEIVYSGRYCEMEEGVQLGLVDEIVSGEELLSRSFEEAQRLARIPPDTFRLIKRELREPYLANLERSKALAREIQDIWMSERTHAAIREYLRRLQKGPQASPA